MKTLYTRLYRLLALAWVVVMLVLTLTPAQDMPRTPEWRFLSFDTAAHAGVFAVLAALGWAALRGQARRPALAVLVGCVLFGGLIEVLQYLMAVGRHAEWTDLIGDSLGAALALLLVRGGWRWWQARRGAALLLLASLALAAPAARAQDAVDLARARHTIKVLAAPRMHGRGYVLGGEHKAAAYLRGRLRQLGLQPLASGFTQPFGLNVNTFPGKVSLQVYSDYLHAAPDARLMTGTDFIIAPESGGTPGPGFFFAVRLDTLCFTNTYSQSLTQRDARLALRMTQLLKYSFSKPFLVLTAQDEKRLMTLPLPLRQTLDSLPNRVLLVPKLTASLASSQGAVVLLEALNNKVWNLNSSHRGRIGRLHFQLDTQFLHNYPTQNLVAVVRGRTQPDSFLVVTAHYDHLGMMGKKTYFPGANDNASGVALLLELAAHYARPENQPACSVAFLLFGAEEAGLVGSAYFVQHPLIPLRSIRFLFNLDLLGTGEEGATVVNGRVLPAAFQRLTALNDAQHYLPRLTARGPAANSDHYPFSQAGVPAFFLYTRGGSLAYHDVNDRPAALSLAGFAGAYGLVRDFLDASGARP